MCFSLNPVCFDWYSHQPRDRWIVDLVANEYLGDTRDPIRVRDIYREMMGDVMFNIPALQLAKYHSGETQPVIHIGPLQLFGKKGLKITFNSDYINFYYIFILV